MQRVSPPQLVPGSVPKLGLYMAFHNHEVLDMGKALIMVGL